MIENNAVKKMVRSILNNRQNTLSDRDIMHPEREWFLGVFVGLIILTLAIFWSVKTYIQFDKITVSDLEEKDKKSVYKDLLVESALVDFADRKKMYSDLKEDLISKTEKVEVIVPEPALESVELASSTDSLDLKPKATAADEDLIVF